MRIIYKEDLIYAPPDLPTVRRGEESLLCPLRTTPEAGKPKHNYRPQYNFS